MYDERSSLLVDEHSIQVSPSLATAIGLKESIFLQQLHYWLQQKPHIREGRPWVYNTVDGWRLQFPFWSKRTLERLIQKLKKGNFIITTAKHNTSKSDKKLWYSINYCQLSEIKLIKPVEGENTGVEQPISDQSDNVAGWGYRQSDGLGQRGHRQSDGMGQKSGSKCPSRQNGGIHDDNLAVQVNTRVERPISAHFDKVAVSNRQSDGAARQSDGTIPDNVAVSDRQLGAMDHDSMAVSNRQHGGIHNDKVAGSLKGTETNTETTTETNTEITTTTTTILDPPGDPGSPQPEDVVVVVLSTHGLAPTIARRFAKKYPKEYLFEKVEFLKFEQNRTPDLANPAGWLRKAVEEDFAKPPGFQTASEIEAEQVVQAQREAAALAAQRADQQARVKAQQAREKAAAAAKAEKFADQLALVQPSYGTTEALLQAWDEGVRYMAKSSLGSIQMLMDGLRKTVLLTFEAGHAQIGVWDGPAHHALKLRGKQFLKECLAYAMRDTLEGRSGTYELLLLNAEQGS